MYNSKVGKPICDLFHCQGERTDRGKYIKHLNVEDASLQWHDVECDPYGYGASRSHDHEDL